ncbi:helix-turn-helix domain-containing protein [Lysinibacillus sp. BW-2-10]|uniref:helix-turn-helix domain-containing protein n=1 Tax=Lysinibacillus sp. BW-2-10 TaxID=2590030 RepID=UPI00117C7489|nr:helix-turn-helix transcriptional regulator [Lysinibacillus sp. BW-2-10]TSI07405.1 helix-turn-helix transcriptional regulator [Lysinibacillus sp. BW-2-10]
MNFGRLLREYREDELNITQSEAAYQLDIVPSTYSNYERCDRSVPIALLPKIKEAFNIPDEQFLNMILNRPHNRKKLSAEGLAMQTKELRERYITNFGESYFDLIQQSPELRQLLGFIHILDVKKRKLLLNALKSILLVYDDMLNKEIEVNISVISTNKSYVDLIQQSPELQQLLAFIDMLDVKKKRYLLNAIKSLLIVYDDLIEKELEIAGQS